MRLYSRVIALHIIEEEYDSAAAWSAPHNRFCKGSEAASSLGMGWTPWHPFQPVRLQGCAARVCSTVCHNAP